MAPFIWVLFLYIAFLKFLLYNLIGDTMYERLELLIGDKIDLIKNKTVLIIGLGGVGGYALETIVRSGIGKVIIVDYDIIDKTNLNRQILSLNDNIGLKKTDVAFDRIKNINPNCEVIKIDKLINKENIDILFSNHIDYVIDACDTTETKKCLIRECLNRKIKFISSMGTGNKLEPSKLEIMDIRKTSYDPLAKIIRKMVKDEKLKGKIMVVSSFEEPIKTNSKTIGSTAFVPSIAGILCASYVINDIVSDKYDKQ